MVKDAKRQLKLPGQQLFILSICRFAEPVAMTSVYPYIVSPYPDIPFTLHLNCPAYSQR